MEKSGILLLYKPLGVRSTSCVSLVKRLGGGRLKVGHAGTLDSTAEGLLAILVGKATRLSRYIMNFPKKYAVTVQFGITTSTDDASGEILERYALPSPDDLEARVDRILPSF
ncbi:MAG TPA: tRNA pseudouridine(55) synthase TruB, partial [Synergistaceae bacterium]|nr:tRNA pseudouridine(55) synthase TruB [Synergistaceae bacterium]